MSETNQNRLRDKGLKMSGKTTQSSELSTHHSMLIRIADINISILSQDPRLNIAVEGATERFLIDKVDPDVMVQARWGNLTEKNNGRKIFDSGALW
jgi:hypothetical protein